MGTRLSLLALVLSSGCIEHQLVPCGELLCPLGTVCGPNTICVAPERLEACVSSAEGDGCTYTGITGTCRDGACTAVACGDGTITSPEQCEGTNLNGATCLTYGFYEPDGLVCSPDCVVDTAACTGRCGDGITNGPELCDTTPGLAAGCSEVGFDYGSVACSPLLCSPSYRNCVRYDWKERAHTFDYPTRVFAAAPDDTYINGIGAPFIHVTDTSTTTVPVPTGCSGGIWATSTGVVYTAGISKVCRYDGTWQETTLPGGHTATAIWGRAETDLYAAGSAIAHYDGASWTTAFAPALAAGAYFNVLHGNATVLAAATNDGQVAYFDGSSWSIETVEPGWYVQSIYVDSMNRVYVAASGTLRVRTSTGWTNAGKPTTASDLRFPWGLGNKLYVEGFTITGGNALWQYDGSAWLETPSATTDISMFTGSASHLVATATYESFYEWSGYGWSKLYPTQDAVVDLWASGSDNVYATDGLDLSHFNGDTWSKSNPVSGRIDAVWGHGSDFVVIATSTGALKQKSGSSWPDMPTTVPFYATDLWGNSPTNLYASGRNANGTSAVVHHWAGLSWQPVLSVSGSSSFGTIVGSSAGAYALLGSVGTGESVYFHAASDPLDEWSALTLPTTVPPAGIWCDDQRLIVTFADRTMYQLVGTAWTKLDTSLRAPPRLLSGEADDLFGTTSTQYSNNVLFHSNGLTWDEVTPPSELSYGTRVVFAGNGVVVVGGAEGVSFLIRP